MIIQIILVTIFIIILNRWAIKQMEKSRDFIERIAYAILLGIADIYLVIYYFDRFNLSSTLKLDINVNTQNWLTIITTCASSIIASTIGGIIAFVIARNQVNENSKQNVESLRIQNMPMLKYEISTNCETDEEFIDKDVINTIYSKDSKPTYNLFIAIKNIGLNNIRRIIIDIESPVIDNVCRIFGQDGIVPIEKNETKNIYKYLTLESGKDYIIKLNIYYQDVLQNWYKQVIELNYSATKRNDGISQIANVTYEVNEEKIVSKEELNILFPKTENIK